MAQYFTDFSEYTTGAQPSDWTRRFGSATYEVKADAGAIGGKVLEVSGSRNLDFFTWDLIDSDADRADVEILFKVKHSNQLAEMRALARGSDTSGRTGYIGGNRREDNIIGQAEFVGGSFTDLGLVNPTSGRFPNGQYLFVRFRVNGTSVKVKSWPSDESEPASWDREATESSITAAGWVGLYTNRTSVDSYDYFSVATNGETAAGVPSTGTTLSLPAGSVDTSGNFSGGVDTTDPAGTLSYVVTRSEVEPSATQVIAGENEDGVAAFASASQGVSATGTQTVTGTGLDSSITHYIYFVQDGGVEQSAVVGSLGFDNPPPPATPTGLTATEITSTSALLSWTRGV